jgi:gamma-glutamyltranspeptidase/glutathione hydrolase
MSLRDAIEYPRVHLDLSRNLVEAEPGAIVEDVAANLTMMGYTLDPKLRSQGDVEAIMIDPETGWRIGSSDGRRGGSAKGY